jgi:hypothetical protein
VSFIDDFNKFTLIYLLKHKSFHKYQEFQCMVERLFDRKSDKKQRGGEGVLRTLFDGKGGRERKRRRGLGRRFVSVAPRGKGGARHNFGRR